MSIHQAMAAPSLTSTAEHPGDPEWGRAARRDLLEQITDFLLMQDLAVTPDNLTIAHAILTGSDLELSRKVTQRQISGSPITQDWLDSLVERPTDPAVERESLDRMMASIESAIHGFSQTTESARSETGACESEVRKHVTAMDTSGEIAPDQLKQLSTAMLGTLKRIEDSVQKSQSETQNLQAQLEKARRDANSDHLTGLPNRRAFEDALLEFHGKALAENSSLYIAICDVDHFKRINDTFGHETGDRLLRAIAGVLQRFAAEDTFVARHGGEEFVILIRDVDADEAFARLDDARRELAGRKFVARREKRNIGQVTFSAGVADVLTTENPRDALAAADAALYQAKDSGRNQVILA